MTDAHPTADGSDTPRTDAAKAIVAQFASDELVELVGELIGQLERELIDARRSLRREENARKNAVSEFERVRAEALQLKLDRQHIAELISGHDGYVFDDIARVLGIQPDEEKS